LVTLPKEHILRKGLPILSDLLPEDIITLDQLAEGIESPLDTFPGGLPLKHANR
jgi:hypothetical protein